MFTARIIFDPNRGGGWSNGSCCLLPVIVGAQEGSVSHPDGGLYTDAESVRSKLHELVDRLVEDLIRRGKDYALPSSPIEADHD